MGRRADGGRASVPMGGGRAYVRGDLEEQGAHARDALEEEATCMCGTCMCVEHPLGCVWALSRWRSFTWRSPPCAARWTNNGPDGGSRLLHWDGSHQFDASGNKVKCRGQFVGGRVLRAEVQKANEGHQAWEASQVHTFLHSDWCGTRSLTHSLTHSLRWMARRRRREGSSNKSSPRKRRRCPRWSSMCTQWGVP